MVRALLPLLLWFDKIKRFSVVPTRISWKCGEKMNGGVGSLFFRSIEVVYPIQARLVSSG